MLLNELNLNALDVNAESVLPVVRCVNIEGHEITFKITSFQSGFGSGKKTVISGNITRADNDTKKLIENADVEKLRRVVTSLCELTKSGRTTERKLRAPKERSEVEQLRGALAVARRLPKEWIHIDVKVLRNQFKIARKEDREKEQKELQVRAVDPILAKIKKLSPKERALLLSSLQ